MSISQSDEAASGDIDTILVVEDEELLNEVLVQTLEDAGYKVVSAFNGQEALALFTENRDTISVVLSDIGLPKLNGIQLFEELQKIDQHVKMILASGFIDPSQKAKLVQSGVHGIVKKPYEPAVILEKIRSLLDKD